jgi:hypothetical protein
MVYVLLGDPGLGKSEALGKEAGAGYHTSARATSGVGPVCPKRTHRCLSSSKASMCMTLTNFAIEN